jgi:hypothetical protein
VATSVVVVIVTVRGLVRGFQPVTDNGLFELRAWDVFTADHPLLGTWSSASVASDVDVNHPGPLLFDWFAVPVRVLGGAAGIAVASALLTLGAVWVSVLTARRLGGPSAALAVAAATAVLCWSMGSELLFDPWPPNLLVLPFFAFLVTIWAVAVGRSWSLVLAVVIGSLCMQSHLSYLFVVPGLLVAGVVALAVADGRRTWELHRRPLLVSAGVGLVAWAQPLWEQLTGGSEGNIAMLATSGTSGTTRNGLSIALRMAGSVVGLPPWWGRPSYASAIPVSPWTEDGELDLSGLPSLPIALVSLIVVAGILVALTMSARRRGDRVTATGAVLAGVAIVLAVATAAAMPIDALGILPHKVRWMWPVAAFAGVVLGDVALRAWRRATWVAVAAALVALVLTVPTYRHEQLVAGPVAQHAAWDSVRSLRDQLEPLESSGVVLFDLEGRAFNDPYSFPLMAEMARRGVPFRVTGRGDVRHVGERRRFDGAADTRMWYRTGSEAELTPPGATRIAYAPGDATTPPAAVFVEPFVPGPDGT